MSERGRSGEEYEDFCQVQGYIEGIFYGFTALISYATTVIPFHANVVQISFRDSSNSMEWNNNCSKLALQLLALNVMQADHMPILYLENEY